MNLPDSTYVLAGLLDGRQWFSAAELASTIRKLGLTPPSAQALGRTLGRFTRESCPLFESRQPWGGNGFREYRVTQFGRTLLANTFDGARLVQSEQRGACFVTAKADRVAGNSGPSNQAVIRSSAPRGDE